MLKISKSELPDEIFTKHCIDYLISTHNLTSGNVPVYTLKPKSKKDLLKRIKKEYKAEYSALKNSPTPPELITVKVRLNHDYKYYFNSFLFFGFKGAELEVHLHLDTLIKDVINNKHKLHTYTYTHFKPHYRQQVFLSSETFELELASLDDDSAAKLLAITDTVKAFYKSIKKAKSSYEDILVDLESYETDVELEDGTNSIKLILHDEVPETLATEIATARDRYIQVIKRSKIM